MANVAWGPSESHENVGNRRVDRQHELLGVEAIDSPFVADPDGENRFGPDRSMPEPPTGDGEMLKEYCDG
jgi:hypothetical protein